LLFSLRDSVAPYFTNHNSSSGGSDNSSNNFEKTRVLYGSDKVIDTALQFTSNARSTIDACIDHTRPSIIVEIRELKKTFHDAKNRGVKLRYITEITAENTPFCKSLMALVDELRHLDGIKGNFFVSETEYIAPAALHEKGKPSSQIVYSNMKQIVEEQQYVFDTLWNKSLSADDKIKEIELGIEPEYFRVINDNEEATNILMELARNAKYEILFLLPNDKALTRIDKLGIFEHLIGKCNKGFNGKEKEGEEGEFQAKIICPVSDANLNIVNRILQNTTGSSNNIRIVNGIDSSFGMIIVDNTKFLKAELREPEAEQFSETIGLSFYSNSKPSVESYKLFFELLWNERTTNEQFKLSDKMQKEFINIAAHELRTPTQAITGYSELLATEPENGRMYVNPILRNSKRLQRLSEDILDVTRIESQSLKLTKEEFDLNDVILSIVGDYRSLLPDNENNANLNIIYEPYSIIVNADKERIAQVVTNLLSNAIKFTTKEKGTIYVMPQKKDSEIVVSLKDTGQGIDPEILPKLFTKFATKSLSGTGLGLFISKSIIEAHGGSVWGWNNLDGKGATFSFSVPITQ
jgi:two-component system, OmpR family, sensor histidine kinase VicK